MCLFLCVCMCVCARGAAGPSLEVFVLGLLLERVELDARTYIGRRLLHRHAQRCLFSLSSSSPSGGAPLNSNFRGHRVSRGSFISVITDV